MVTGFHLVNYPMGGMMGKDVTKFYKLHLGDRGMFECGFIHDFEFWKGGW